MKPTIFINPGEIKVKLNAPIAGKTSFADLGLDDNDLKVHGGNLRLVFDLEGIGEHQYYQVPTVEVSYDKNLAETHWICEFNEEVVLDKTDNHGHSTVILLNRKKLAELEHHHQNKLIIHGDFPDEVTISAEGSFINFFK